MTREEYVMHRNNDDKGNIVYFYYNEVCKERGIIPFEPHKFITLFNTWAFSRIATSKVIDYYDNKFEILSLNNTKGEAVKFL